MASIMHICSGLVGPKSGNVEKVPVFNCFFEGSRVQKVFCENEQLSETDRLGGGRGRVNPPLGNWFGGFGRFGGFGT